jgi:hypothetical protein
MAPDCVAALRTLPPATLQKLLMKGSMRMIKSLVIAYPQLFGAAILDALATRVNPLTLRALIDEINRAQFLTPAQVRLAEGELMRLLQQENLQ